MHTLAHAPCSWPTSWMHVNLWDLSPLCPVSPHTDWKSFSPSLSFILCAHTLNRWSPFDSVLFLPLSLWAPASSYLPFHPESHDTPFILSLLRLCHCLHHTLQGVAVNMRLYPGAELQHRDGIIFRNTCDAFKEVQKVILMIFFHSLLLCHSGDTVPLPSFARLWPGNIPVRSRHHGTGAGRRQAETGHVPLP